ncbi:uncharacterized protein [Amphiura filiformis]|uniref:uncharacterized protein n=1 Tax=Amphiura filiformis TaxID=82378 RepID=UPI003B226503
MEELEKEYGNIVQEKTIMDGSFWFNTKYWFWELSKKLSAIFPQLDSRIVEDLVRPMAERLQRVFGRIRKVPYMNSTPPRRPENYLGSMDYVEPGPSSDLVMGTPKKLTKLKIQQQLEVQGEEAMSEGSEEDENSVVDLSGEDEECMEDQRENEEDQYEGGKTDCVDSNVDNADDVGDISWPNWDSPNDNGGHTPSKDQTKITDYFKPPQEDKHNERVKEQTKLTEFFRTQHGGRPFVTRYRMNPNNTPRSNPNNNPGTNSNNISGTKPCDIPGRSADSEAEKLKRAERLSHNSKKRSIPPAEEPPAKRKSPEDPPEDQDNTSDDGDEDTDERFGWALVNEKRYKRFDSAERSYHLTLNRGHSVRGG